MSEDIREDQGANPPVLKPPEMGKPLILYIVIEKESVSVGAMLAQEGLEGVSMPFTILARDYSHNYDLDLIEKKDVFNGLRVS